MRFSRGHFQGKYLLGLELIVLGPVINWVMSMKVLILLASCQQVCMTYTIALCTVKNS